MAVTIFETQSLGYFGRVKASWMMKYYQLLYAAIILSGLAIIFDWNIKYFFLLLTLMFAIVVVMRIFVFRDYLQKIEASEDSIILTIQTGIFSQTIKELEIKKGNFKIRFFRDPKYFSFFLIEQRKPYKLIMNQYCFGHWQKKDSMEILRDYASSVQYFEGIHPSDTP